MRSMMRVSVRGVSERRTGFKDRDRRDLQHAPTAERWIGRLMKLARGLEELLHFVSSGLVSP